MVWRLSLLDNPSRNTRRKHGAKEELQVMTGQQCRSPHVLKCEQPPRECDSIRVWAFLPVSRPGAARRRREATGLEAEERRGGGGVMPARPRAGAGRCVGAFVVAADCVRGPRLTCGSTVLACGARVRRRY